MNKWADYLISCVSYTPERLISGAIRHKDTDKGITEGEHVDRITLTSDIKHGLSYITIYSGKDSWKKGNKLKIFSIDGDYYLRTDENKAKLDYLGDIPEIPITQSDKELESKSFSKSTPSEVKPAEVTKPKGTLPKQSSDELPQELDLAPEPITDSDEATPEQLLRLEQLEKQIKKLESTPAEVKPAEVKPAEVKPAEVKPAEVTKPKGALPKQSSDELPQELDLVPEPITDSDEVTPEQLLRLEQLEKQIKKLSRKVSSKKPSSKKPKSKKS